MTSPPTNRSFFRRELPAHLIELSTAEGKRRFTRALCSDHADAFFSLTTSFQTQSHPAYCGLTTLAAVLNAMRIDPQRVWKHPWRWYTEALLHCCLSPEHVEKHGVTVDQLAAIGKCEGVLVDVFRGSDLEEMRQIVKDSVSGGDESSNGLLVASYDRSVLSQTGSGHFSPIAAYDEATDSVLILDTARFKYAPHWIDLSLLIKATRSIDRATGISRGFIRFQKPGQAKSQLAKNCDTTCCLPNQAEG